MSPPPNLSDLLDQDVVARARQGHEPAYAELMRRYQGPVYTLIYRIVRERTVAEDLTQDTFVKAFAALDRYCPERKFSSWIFKIANNLSVDYLRHQQLETEALEQLPHAATPPDVWATPPGATTPGDPTPAPVDPDDVRRALHQAIARLKGNYRRCAALRHVHGRSYDSIGEILDLPLGTVKTYLHRFRTELRDTLEARRNA